MRPVPEGGWTTLDNAFPYLVWCGRRVVVKVASAWFDLTFQWTGRGNVKGSCVAEEWPRVFILGVCTYSMFGFCPSRLNSSGICFISSYKKKQAQTCGRNLSGELTSPPRVLVSFCIRPLTPIATNRPAKTVNRFSIQRDGSTLHIARAERLIWNLAFAISELSTKRK